MSPGSTEQQKILLVDDTPLNLILLGNALSQDYDLRIVTSGEEAVRVATTLQPDLILLDIMMPGIDGLETCRRLKADPALRHTPIIFVTALGEMEFEATGLKLGASDYLTKPLNVDLAKQRIRNLLDRERLRKEVEAHRDSLEDLVAERSAQLKSSEALYRGLVEQSVVGVYKSIGGRLTFVNSGLAAMLGYPDPADLLGDGDPAQMVARKDLEVFGTWPEGSRDGRSFIFTAIRSDGSRVTLESHEMRLDDGDADATDATIQGMVIDITERREAELAQQSALAAAEHLAGLKTQFVNNASHELRTPLNAVLGFAEVGLGTQDIARAHRFFSLIRESGTKLLDIVASMLDFSAAEAGGLVLEPAPFDAAKLLKSCADRYRSLAESKGLVFNCEGLPAVATRRLGDSKRIGQIIGQLLDNAVKFTPDGSVTLSIVVSADTLRCEVTDTGVGMVQQQVEQAFTPFHQIDGSSTRQFGGLGLGLALVKYLIDLMRGRIGVTSNPGHGTRFVLEIPLPEA